MELFLDLIPVPDLLGQISHHITLETRCHNTRQCYPRPPFMSTRLVNDDIRVLEHDIHEAAKLGYGRLSV